MKQKGERLGHGPSDEELIASAIGGDEAAFEQLYAENRRKTFGICLKMVGATIAPDLDQEIWIAIYEKLGTFRGDSRFSTWIHRIAVNQCLMHFRKNYVRYETPVDESAEHLLQVAEIRELRHCTRPSVMASLVVQEAIEKLPPGYRNVLQLFYLEGYEHEEIARILGIETGTSKSQLHKAKQKMRKVVNRKVLASETRALPQVRQLPVTALC